MPRVPCPPPDPLETVITKEAARFKEATDLWTAPAAAPDPLLHSPDKDDENTRTTQDV